MRNPLGLADAMLTCHVARGSHLIDDANRSRLRYFPATPGLRREDMHVVEMPTARGTATAGHRQEMRALPASGPARLSIFVEMGLPGAGAISDQGIIAVIRVLRTASTCRARATETGRANALSFARRAAGPEDTICPTRRSQFGYGPHKTLIEIAISGDLL